MLSVALPVPLSGCFRRVLVLLPPQQNLDGNALEHKKSLIEKINRTPPSGANELS